MIFYTTKALSHEWLIPSLQQGRSSLCFEPACESLSFQNVTAIQYDKNELPTSNEVWQNALYVLLNTIEQLPSEYGELTITTGAFCTRNPPAEYKVGDAVSSGFIDAATINCDSCPDNALKNSLRYLLSRSLPTHSYLNDVPFLTNRINLIATINTMLGLEYQTDLATMYVNTWIQTPKFVNPSFFARVSSPIEAMAFNSQSNHDKELLTWTWRGYTRALKNNIGTWLQS